MRRIVLALCVTLLPLGAAASERHDAQLAGGQPIPTATERLVQNAEDTLITLVDQAQHLSARGRDWLWVTPVLSSQMCGATVRVDFR